MGLDITAYRGLVKVGTLEPSTDYDYEKQFYAHPASIEWAEGAFPGRSEGIEPGALYTFADSFSFKAGSYGGYNDWRRDLARFADHKSDNSAPFAELIDFADNEGVIGPVVAAKLAKDFAEHDPKAVEYGAKIAGNWWHDLYAKWRQAFEMAADNGAVDFH